MSKHAITWTVIFGVITLMFLRLPQMAATQDVVVNTYGALVEVDALVRQQYVEPVESDQLVDGAIHGMMRELDPYSGYISGRELAAFERRNSGDYIGVGVYLGFDAGQLTIIAPIPGSPAAHSGVRPGDVILSIDGKDVSHASVFDAEDLLVGRPQTKVTLVVLPEGSRDPETLVMKRAPVHVRTVRGYGTSLDGAQSYMLDAEHRMAYVRISNFHEHTSKEFADALRHIENAGAKGLIIDLRFDPGGIMTEAIAIVDMFVPDGILLTTESRRRAVEEYRATAEGTVATLPLVVLINGSSASSAEIVSGVLQARQRATVVGSRSFGKGCAQHLIYLKDRKAAIKLTTDYYRLPDGRCIHRTAENTATSEWGIIPDVIIPLSKPERRAVMEARRRIDLGIVGDPNAPTPHDQAPLSPATPGLKTVPMDRQLAKALEVIIKRSECETSPP